MCFKNDFKQKVSLMKVVLLISYSSMKKKFGMIRMIFDTENLLWKSNFCTLHQAGKARQSIPGRVSNGTWQRNFSGQPKLFCPRTKGQRDVPSRIVPGHPCLSMDKNRYFLTPPPHLVHVIIGWPLGFRDDNKNNAIFSSLQR